MSEWRELTAIAALTATAFRILRLSGITQPAAAVADPEQQEGPNQGAQALIQLQHENTALRERLRQRANQDKLGQKPAPAEVAIPPDRPPSLSIPLPLLSSHPPPLLSSLRAAFLRQIAAAEPFPGVSG